MAFNSRKDTELLLRNGCILQEVDKLQYLGMTFNRTVNLKNSQKALVQQSINPIRSGGGGLKSPPPPPIFCPHAFNFGATLLCVVDFTQKIV